MKFSIKGLFWFAYIYWRNPQWKLSLVWMGPKYTSWLHLIKNLKQNSLLFEHTNYFRKKYNEFRRCLTMIVWAITYTSLGKTKDSLEKLNHFSPAKILPDEKFWHRTGNSCKDNFAVWFFTLRFSLWRVQRIGNGILVKINKMICG